MTDHAQPGHGADALDGLPLLITVPVGAKLLGISRAAAYRHGVLALAHHNLPGHPAGRQRRRRQCGQAKVDGHRVLASQLSGWLSHWIKFTGLKMSAAISSRLKATSSANTPTLTGMSFLISTSPGSGLRKILATPALARS